MDGGQFWSIIAESRRDLRKDRADGNMDAQLAALHDLLLGLTPEELRQFNEELHDRLLQAYSWKLWGTAALLSGGSCSDDSFTDFCSWLVSMGRNLYEEALRDPDTLASAVSDPTVEDYFFEEFQYVPAKVYEESTGQEAPAFSRNYPEHPQGPKLWESPADLETQYPKLWMALHPAG